MKAKYEVYETGIMKIIESKENKKQDSLLHGNMIEFMWYEHDT